MHWGLRRIKKVSNRVIPNASSIGYYIYIYIERESVGEREMVEFGESDKVIKISEKVN